MPDQSYRSFNLILQSRGISARAVDDQTPASTYLNMDNCEELAEESVGSRLGTQIVNRSGTVINPLNGLFGATLVHSVAKLSGLSSTAFRYAGVANALWRRTGLTQGPYTIISGGMSGNPWQAVAFQPAVASNAFMFFADTAGMLKDNGSFAVPQQMGIFQPQFPIAAKALSPSLIVLDNYTGALTYTYPQGSPGTLTPGGLVNTTTTSAVTAIGVQTVSVANPQQVGLFQLLTIDSGGSQETVLGIFVTPTGFTANFTITHAPGVPVVAAALEMTGIPDGSTQQVQASFGGTPIASWPTTLQAEDYIGLYLYVGDPTQVQSIQLAFDCGDGSFTENYFYKTIAQGPLQSLLNTAGNNSTAATTAATDALLDESLGLYGNSEGSIVQLLTGQNNWNPLLIQLSDFAGAGRASFTDPVFNWSAVNGYQVTIVMNDGTSSTSVFLGSLILFGGAGPDSFAGVSYDWLFTFYNNVDGTESNPCMVMSNVNPPNETNFLLPRRQPCLLTMTYPNLDPQTTSLRIYRRGGTLGDNYRRVDEVLITGSPQQYTDIASDSEIEDADFISFVNDVPVTSSLPTPVNTTLTAAIVTTNQIATVTPASMVGISVGQQVTLGNVTPISLISDTETVIVLNLGVGNFTAFVQNEHAIGEQVTATAQYGKPVTIMASAFDQLWFAGDSNNPNYLYWSAKSNGQAVSSAAFVAVSTPDDPITAIVQFKGNLYVSTVKAWWAVAPGSNANASPTVYPTACKKGCVAPLGYIVTEEAIYYQAIDGIRAFAGGASTYLTQDQEFIFQDVGSTPIVEANQTQLVQTRAAYWNSMLFFSYIGVDAKRHRLIFHSQYKRWRNDDLDVQSIVLEADTNTLVWGDSKGLVHLDRQNVPYDEGNNAGNLVQLPIQMDLQLPFLNQGAADIQKNYNELTLDVNTNGQELNVELLFDDGEETLSLGPIMTTERQKVNINIESGLGFNAYKVSLNLTCAATAAVYLYQAAIRCVFQARTRQSMDTYWLRQGTDASKLSNNFFAEYDSPVPLTGNVYYDQDPNPFFTFTLPASVRQSMRVRLPAVKYRLIRLVITGDEDFQVWDESFFTTKEICSSRGYSVMRLTPDQ